MMRSALLSHSAASAHAASAAITAGSDSRALWYATRATGVVALLLLTATVALGIAGVHRLSSPRWPRVITAGLHRNVSLLAVAFVLVHVLTTVLDSYVQISLASAVVPFTSSYRPLWLGLGAIAFDLLFAVALTSLARARIGYRAWRAVHLLAYASWPVALWHGLGTGTDTRLPWLIALDAFCVLLVAAVVLGRVRLLTPGPRRAAAIAATLLLPALTLVFAVAGPMRPGWAARAGTPPAASPATLHGPGRGVLRAQR
jgi:sulfoxide reductase heme-binding subunit YedZ